MPISLPSPPLSFSGQFSIPDEEVHEEALDSLRNLGPKDVQPSLEAQVVARARDQPVLKVFRAFLY